MDITSFAVRLILLLAPGIVAALIVEKLTVHKEWPQFRFGLYSLLFGLSSYILLYTIVGVINSIPCLNSSTSLHFWASVTDGKSKIEPLEIIWALVLSIPLGIVSTVVITRKVVHRLANKFRITEKFGDESLYYFALNSPDVYWVRVKMPEIDTIYEGWRQSFSEDEKTREILLRSVKVFRMSDSEFWYELPAIYLSVPKDKVIIEMPSLTTGD